MTLIAGVKGDEFYITMNCGAQAEAKKQGVDLDFQGPDQFDATLQTPIVNGVVAKKPDAILIAPTDAKAMYVPIKQAADAGIKIVLVDTTLEQADLAVSQIASDNVGGGKAAAKALAEAIGGSGAVFVNNTKPGISTTDQRAEGFEAEAKNLGLDYTGMEYNQDQPDKAAAITKAQLAKNPDLKGIFATNLFGAEGSATGLREAGKQDKREDRRLRRRPEAGQGPRGRAAPGARRPEAGRHRRAGRPAGRRGAQGRADQGQDRHRLGDPHQGQPGREPGLRLQVQLLNAGGSPARLARAGERSSSGSTPSMPTNGTTP